ncbi:MAG TPA: DinB family protein [Gemmatimonadales bacterium]
MRLVDPLIAELEQEAETTRRVLERIPEDELGWRPHEKSMSLGQLALHIATTPGGVAQIAGQDSMERPDFSQRPEAKTRREVLGALEESVATALEFLRGLDDARATQSWSMTFQGKTVFSQTRIRLVRTIMLNHWYHHRGEMQVYLRLLGVPVPSVYGPTADEDPFVASGTRELQRT